MTQTGNNDNLFPIHDHNQETDFTEEEIQDILRFAEDYSLNVTNTAELMAFVREVRAAHNKRAQNKGRPTPWPTPN